MRTRPSHAAVLLIVALFCAACESGTSSELGGGAASQSGSVEGAMADLQVSSAWLEPRCRWLETGTWILAYRQESALYEAARDLGYINLEQVGSANRIGTPEPAWKVTLTETGKAQSARCGRGSTDPKVWGLPVSERRFIAGKRVKEPDQFNPDMSVFAVEFEWMPTVAGERVKHLLTDKMAVEEGLAESQVSLRYRGAAPESGPNGWWVYRMSDGYVGGT